MPRLGKSPHHLPHRQRLERFFIKGAEGDCWNWRGSLDAKGYGFIRLNGRMVRSHRASFAIYEREIPEGAHILHQCDNPACVNPQHLVCSDNKRNQDEAWMRDRKKNVRKLSRDDLIAIRNSNELQNVLAAKYGVNQSEISRIKNQKRGVGIMKIGLSLSEVGY